jgi:hypothetical protein
MLPKLKYDNSANKEGKEFPKTSELWHKMLIPHVLAMKFLMS